MLQFLSLAILSLATLQAEESYWNHSSVKSYVHNSEMQRRWAWKFLTPHLKQLNGNERIIDIGCGDGKITADIANFVPQGYVIGIDPSHAMLDFARKQYHALEYPNLAFLEGSFLELSLSSTFDRIISCFALQHSADPEKAIQILYQHLNPKGKLLCVVPLMQNLEWLRAGGKVMKSAKWIEYWKDYVPRKFFTEKQYLEFLQAANFQSIHLQTVKSMDPFVNRTEMIDWMEGTMPPRVPPAKAREFFAEWIDAYIELKPDAVSHQGVIYAEIGYIQIEAARGE